MANYPSIVSLGFSGQLSLPFHPLPYLYVLCILFNCPVLFNANAFDNGALNDYLLITYK